MKKFFILVLMTTFVIFIGCSKEEVEQRNTVTEIKANPNTGLNKETQATDAHNDYGTTTTWYDNQKTGVQ